MNLSLSLSDLDTEVLEIASQSPSVTLESLVGGHAMAEMAASCSVCSCCVVCCCCCCS
ncbi:thiomuracin/GE37468 family thiazolyl RiPP peptide [Rhizocola hellebori]|uniref:thiomuracin/GE37468 family thiazolyl RiPP peptide n=1 Tax=Rhizocola hellebori TaxID=1392758 RepID=UPI003570BC1A